MFRKLIKHKKAQTTAEYAILIALVVAGIVAMQVYAQRGLQAQIKDGVAYLVEEGGLGDTYQYEPYYLKSNYDIATDETETKRIDDTTIALDANRTSGRLKGGYQESIYNETISGGEDW